ncbi:hypothetical protein [Caudoviricetes sp.]|nr:hypothetical protein [Caudoviricetes sp.]
MKTMTFNQQKALNEIFDSVFLSDENKQLIQISIDKNNDNNFSFGRIIDHAKELLKMDKENVFFRHRIKEIKCNNLEAIQKIDLSYFTSFSTRKQLMEAQEPTMQQYGTMIFIRLCMPYVLKYHGKKEIGGDLLGLFNREYKPFGLGREHDFVPYLDNQFQIYRTKELTNREIASVTNCYPKDYDSTVRRIKRFKEQKGYIAFYGDGCPPWHNDKFFRAYIERLKAFCDLIENRKIQRVN